MISKKLDKQRLDIVNDTHHWWKLLSRDVKRMAVSMTAMILIAAFICYALWNNQQNSKNQTIQQSDKDEASALDNALKCLRLTKTDLPNLKYPKDALSHFEEIHHRLDKWALHSNYAPSSYSGYDGPWIENHWITHFEQSLNESGNAMQSVFGPYIPIFVAWTTGIWVHGSRYPIELAKALNDSLREDVLYITVVQNDQGFPVRNKAFADIQDRYALTVLSSGGYGHVPIPLFKQPEAIIKPKIPMSERKHLVSYQGSKGNAPENMRQRMLDQGYFYYFGDDWRGVMRQSKFQLCPRGYGRTSFHVMEALQMGLIPIHIYIDQPWLPYAKNIIKSVSFAVTVDELPDLVANLSKMPDAEIESMEQRIEGLRDEYFTYEGAMKQISKFMLNEADNELVCQKLPPTEQLYAIYFAIQNFNNKLTNK